MSDRGWIEPIVERVVAQALDGHVAALRSEIVRQVMEEVAAHPAEEAAPRAEGGAELAQAITGIQLGSSQKEILRALLDASGRYAARTALFVVKGAHASGWQARGFANSDAIKDFALQSSAPAVLHALADRVPCNAAGAEFDAHFLEEFGSSTGVARLLPLILKDKVAALVYADGGPDGKPFDAGSLEVLVLATSAWLEVNALRRQAHKEPAPAADGQNVAAHESSPAPPYNDPFAGHAPAYSANAAGSRDPFASQPPAYTMAAAASMAGVPSDSETTHASASGVAAFPAVEQEASAGVEVQSAAVAVPDAAEPISMAQPHAVPEVAVPAAPSMPPEEQAVHQKAQRFARLLVDEVKLYNQAKVAEGRKNRDLYDRLKDAIEKSRSTYQKRYGSTVAASGNYFQHELVRSLAEDDASLMGPNFHL